MKKILIGAKNGKKIGIMSNIAVRDANAIQNIVYETFNINLDIEPNIIY